MNEEKWKPVLGYEDTYEVSNYGNVRRMAGSYRTPIARPRKLVPRGKYFQVILSRDGRVTLQWVHRLVAAAFLGPPTDRMYQVNHIDGNGRNNRVENLEWTDHSGNMTHAYATGLRYAVYSVGSDNVNSKLTEADIPAIFDRRHCGESLESIGRSYGVTKACIWQIIDGRSWRHIPR